MSIVYSVTVKPDQDIEQEYVEGTHSNIMSKQVDTVKEILGKFFNINPSAKKKSDAHQKNLRERIQENSTQIDQFNKSIPVIQDILIMLAILIMIYMLSGVFGVFTHLLALLALIGGVLYFIYYKKK
jgi:ABC-type xylose transport system permease subunit